MQTVNGLEKRVSAHDELLRRLGALEEENSSLKKEVSRLNSLLAAKPQPVLPPAEQNSPRHPSGSNSDPKRHPQRPPKNDIGKSRDSTLLNSDTTSG